MTNTKSVFFAVVIVILIAAILVHDMAGLSRAEEARREAILKLKNANARQAAVSSAVAANRQRQTLSEASDAKPSQNKEETLEIQLASSEEYRRLLRASAKQRRHLEFQRLYRNLNLTPEQIAQFEAAMVLQEEAKIDAAAARSKGLDEQEIYRASGREWSNSMKALLGEDGFNQLKDYLRAMPVRAFIDKYAVHMGETGSPITPERAEQLAKIALANDFMYEQGKGTDPGTVNWNKTWDPASQILDQRQLEYLERMVLVWASQKSISIQIKAAQGATP